MTCTIEKNTNRECARARASRKGEKEKGQVEKDSRENGGRKGEDESKH